MLMAASKISRKISRFYETRVFTPQDVRDNHGDSSLKPPAAAPIAAAAAAAPGASSSSSSSASVVFKVLCVLRLSVKGNPVNEFLEERNWRKKRQSSSPDLPRSADGLFVDDDDDDDNNNLKIYETLTLLRVPKAAHRSIIDKLRQRAAASPGSAPMIVVEIWEVTQVTLPVIDEEGKQFVEEFKYDDPSDDESDGVVGGDHEPTEDDEEVDGEEVGECINALKTLILGEEVIDEAGHHDDEVAMMKDWFSNFIDAVGRVAWPVPEDMKANEEWTCPICMEILQLEETWSEMRCCSKLFHGDCISSWIKRGKKCPWCRSSLPLVPQSAKGLIRRHESEYFTWPIQPGSCWYLVKMWYLLAEKCRWRKEKLHPIYEL